MTEIINYLFDAYSTYSVFEIVLECLAFGFGIISVIYAKKENILVFPTGITCTIITMYFMFNERLIGHMMVNLFYTLMSIYGWWNWSRKENDIVTVKISKFSFNDLPKASLIFFFIVFISYFLHDYFNTELGAYASLDIFTSGIFVTAMWLMANKKLENWVLWIIGNVITIPLYFGSDKIILSVQYIIFTILAIQGYIQWKKSLSK
ncbi:MAG: nicotinamide mononucleotide transporter [Flavobacteriaceae bacterium]|nr:nicotinamide mononucleotide transporter [Flavobacteriaceae bacterium]|tara:strand:+ start:14 stop:631 length:618 start_codon:yes stop_codon:yes gene_type:complete